MTSYTVHLLGEAGEVRETFRQDWPCDETVIGGAEKLAHPHSIEIWQDCRLVARIPARGAWGLRLPSR